MPAGVGLSARTVGKRFLRCRGQSARHRLLTSFGGTFVRAEKTARPVSSYLHQSSPKGRRLHMRSPRLLALSLPLVVLVMSVAPAKAKSKHHGKQPISRASRHTEHAHESVSAQLTGAH